MLNVWQRPLTRLLLRTQFPVGRSTVLAGGLRDLLNDLEAAAVAASGRYSGNVKRESDGAEFARAIEIDAPAGNTQPIRIYDQVSGGLPSTPQWSGNAYVLGQSILLFSATDSVADRKFASIVLSNFMLSYSVSTYHDGRPDVKLSGVLRKS